MTRTIEIEYLPLNSSIGFVARLPIAVADSVVNVVNVVTAFASNVSLLFESGFQKGVGAVVPSSTVVIIVAAGLVNKAVVVVVVALISGTTVAKTVKLAVVELVVVVIKDILVVHS